VTSSDLTSSDHQVKGAHVDFATADLMDDSGGTAQCCTTQLRQYGGARRFTGLIRTVRCLEDTVLVKQVLAAGGDDHVLVIDGGGSHEAALMGDITARQAMERGWRGVVVFGVVRDTEALGALPFGVKALGTCPRKPRQEGQGQVDEDVTFGGAVFRPGLRLWADDDGIVVESLPVG